MSSVTRAGNARSLRGEGSRRSLWAGFLFGLGAVAFIDEAVLHRLPHRRPFHDGSASGIGLVSDGLFHAFGWFAAVLGLVMVADAARRRCLDRRFLGAGALLGAGGFQSYNGIASHDRPWYAIAVLLLAAGCWPLLSARRRGGAE